MQNADQLYFMMDTQFGGIYQADAAERKKEYGENIIRPSGRNLSMDMMHISYRALLDLVAELMRQKTAVFRKGMDLYMEIDSRDIVPGDMVFLSSGDIVPADVRIIHERQLMVRQHIFTGVDAPVQKYNSLNGCRCSLTSIADIPDICLMGTSVVGGVAKAVVIGTGSATYFGKLVYGY